MKNYIIIPHENGDFKMHRQLYLSIAAYIDAIIKYNQDLVLVFDGAEGAGKSTLMRQVGEMARQYLKNKHNLTVGFGIDNIHFDLDSYTNAAIDNEKQKGIIHILDESRAIANRKRSNSKGNVNFTNYLSECRSAGHIHLIALPAFHDLDSYIASFRQSFLINIQKYFKQEGEDENGVPIYDLKLGEYRVFLNDSKLKAMYYHKMRYIYPRSSVFKGKFDNCSVVDENLYEDKKRESRRLKYQEQEEKGKFKFTIKDQVLADIAAKVPKNDTVSRLNCSPQYYDRVKLGHA